MSFGIWTMLNIPPRPSASTSIITVTGRRSAKTMGFIVTSAGKTQASTPCALELHPCWAGCDGDRSATPHHYLSQVVKLMVELDPGPILIRGQRRVRTVGAGGAPDSHLARGEVEQVGGMVREGHRGIAGSEQA